MIKLGDVVGFKDDVEQYGTVTDVDRSNPHCTWLTIINHDGMTGEAQEHKVPEDCVWED